MYKKVLVVEDLDTIGYGITVMLEQELEVHEVVLSQYCHNAYLKFMKAEREQDPFELLITDLSFSKDYHQDKLSSGKQLIKKIRDLGYTIPIIVCSVEDKPAAVKKLLNRDSISGYVLKGRDGLKNLKHAIETVHNGKSYLSPLLVDSLKQKEVFEVTDYDLKLLTHLSEGLSQNEIAKHFNNVGVIPSSLSSIEKRLNCIKDEFRAKNIIQLVANAKDLGLI